MNRPKRAAASAAKTAAPAPTAANKRAKTKAAKVEKPAEDAKPADAPKKQEQAVVEPKATKPNPALKRKMSMGHRQNVILPREIMLKIFHEVGRSAVLRAARVCKVRPGRPSPSHVVCSSTGISAARTPRSAGSRCSMSSFSAFVTQLWR
jgi:hypothetical protein